MKVSLVRQCRKYGSRFRNTVHPIVLSYPQVELPPTNSLSGIDLGPQLLFPNDFEIFHLWTLEIIEVLLFGSKQFAIISNT